MPSAPAGGKDAPVGGQAVLEGVMVKGPSRWAVAVRAPTPEQRAAHPNGLPRGAAALGPIEVTQEPVVSLLQRHRVLRLPVVRGVVALAESMRIGFRALNVSVNTTMGDEGQEMTAGTWLFALVAGIGLAVGLFFVIPVALTSLVKDELDSAVLFWLVEGALRTAIFVGYLVALTRLHHLRRLFEYHGAEHKAIACHEAGAPLTPESAQRFGRLHPRCGTSFMLVVMVIAIVVLAPVGLPAWYWLVLSRILGVPLVAGLAYELIRATGRHQGAPWARVAMWPGMQLQRLTTREP
ncbi:MAG: hypothetical protein JWO90_675, partial [Solirubrobacterales bacterium]|nr:hypothetical protein [Solirubrobacterales bacterium]